MRSQANSLEYQWMPFSANKHFKAEPRLFTEGKGMYLKNHRGDTVIDGVSGLYCTPAGHGRREIADAVHAQLMTLDFVPPFQFGHAKAFELARRTRRKSHPATSTTSSSPTPDRNPSIRR